MGDKKARLPDGQAPTTALAKSAGVVLDKHEARAMYDWRRVYGKPPTRLTLHVLEEGCYVIEHDDPAKVSSTESYMILDLSNRILGTLCDDLFIPDSAGVVKGKYSCLIFRAGKA